MDLLKRLLSLSLLLAATQCGSKDNTQTMVTILPPEWSDPYLNSIRNRNIKYVILERISLKDLVDTIELDRRGNIIRVDGYGEEERMAYDTNGFLVRRWLRSDVTAQYIARYSIRGDTLVQSWREFNSRDWDLPGDTTTRPYEVNLYIYDHKGRVTQQIGESIGSPAYIYSKDRLAYKEIEIRRGYEEEFHIERIAEFSYDDKEEINQIRLHTMEPEDKEHLVYFSSSLPDSSQITWIREYGSRQERYRYRYIYY